MNNRKEEVTSVIDILMDTINATCKMANISMCVSGEGVIFRDEVTGDMYSVEYIEGK